MSTPGKKMFVGAPRVIKYSISDDQIVQQIDEAAPDSPAPSLDLEKFKVTVVNEPLAIEGGSKFNAAIFDDETQELTVHIPSYTKFEIDMDSFAEHWSTGRRRFDLERNVIGTLEVDESKRPTCAWFIPSMSDKKSELPENWRFTTGYRVSQCVCPDLGRSTKNPGACTYGATLEVCPKYQELLSVEVQVVYKGDTRQASIVKSFTYPRIPVWSVQTSGENEPTEFNTKAEAEEELKSLVLDDDTEIVIMPPAIEKTSYFETVFS